VSLAFGVFLECVRDGNCSVTQILAIHSLNSSIRSLKTGVIDESKPLGVASFRVSLNLRRGQNDTKSRKCVIQQFFINFRIQVSYENISSNIQILLMSRSLVDPDRLTKQFYHVHDLYRVISIIFSKKLHKAITLVLHGDPVLGHVHIHHRPCLDKQLPKQSFIHLFIQPTNIDGGVLVSFRNRTCCHCEMFLKSLVEVNQAI